MANAIKWTAWTSRSTVLTTELNNLAAAARTVAGTEIVNSTNLDQYGKLELNVDFVSAPTAGGYFQIHMVTSPAGAATYEEGSDTIDPGTHTVVAVLPVVATTAAQRLMSPVFAMQPARTKFLLLNSCSQAFPATGSTLTLYTCNDEVQ
jgi:hypothetical protein